MPTQVKVGLILTLGGLVGLIVSLYFKLDAAVIASANVQAAGAALLGKEWFQQSPEAQSVYSKRPPPPPINFVGIVLLMSLFGVSLLAGCAEAEKTVHDAQDEVAQMRERSSAAAADLREDLDAAASSIILARSAVDIACGFYRVDGCTTAESVIAALDAAHKAASAAVDAMERSGLVLESVAAQAGHVVEQARALSATVRALEEAVHAAAQGMAQGEDRPLAPSDSGPAGAPSSEGAAPAAAAP